MNILFISGQFYPKIVGSGTVAYLIAKTLAANGHDVTVAVDEELKIYKNTIKYPFKVEYISSLKSFSVGDVGFRSATLQIYKLIKSSHYDVIHVYSFMPMLLVSLFRDTLSIPIVFTFWNTPNKDERAVGLYKENNLDIELARSIIQMKKYDRVIVGSNCYYDAAISLGILPEDIRKNYIGLDQDEFISHLNRRVSLKKYFDDNINRSDKIITLPGRITPQKGIRESIKALSIVNKRHKIKLLLTGMSDPYKKEFAVEILEEAKKLQVDHLLLIPKMNITRSDLPQIYKRSSIIITPSYYEGFGLSALEALLASRPLIATNTTGLNELTEHMVNSVVIPPKDSHALARAILSLLDDPFLADRISTNAYESVKMFDIKNFVSFLESEYKLLL